MPKTTLRSMVLFIPMAGANYNLGWQTGSWVHGQSTFLDDLPAIGFKDFNPILKDISDNVCESNVGNR